MNKFKKVTANYLKLQNNEFLIQETVLKYTYKKGSLMTSCPVWLP